MKSALRKQGAFFALTFAVVLNGCVTSRPRPKVTVNWDSRAGQSKEQSAVWLGYLIARANYIKQHENEYADVKGILIPHFAEEVDARSKAARTYEELSAKDKKLHDDYFEDLVKVEEAGFMEEYVWTYLRQSTWADSERPSKLAEFASWKEANLPNHRAVTYGSISIRAN